MEEEILRQFIEVIKLHLALSVLLIKQMTLMNKKGQ